MTDTPTPISDKMWDGLHDHQCSDLVRKQVMLDKCRRFEKAIREALARMQKEQWTASRTILQAALKED